MNTESKQKTASELAEEYAPFFKSESMSSYTLTGDYLANRSRTDFLAGFAASEKRAEVLVRALDFYGDWTTYISDENGDSAIDFYDRAAKAVIALKSYRGVE